MHTKSGLGPSCPEKQVGNKKIAWRYLFWEVILKSRNQEARGWGWGRREEDTKIHSSAYHCSGDWSSRPLNLLRNPVKYASELSSLRKNGECTQLFSSPIGQCSQPPVDSTLPSCTYMSSKFPGPRVRSPEKKKQRYWVSQGKVLCRCTCEVHGSLHRTGHRSCGWNKRRGGENFEVVHERYPKPSDIKSHIHPLKFPTLLTPTWRSSGRLGGVAAVVWFGSLFSSFKL